MAKTRRKAIIALLFLGLVTLLYVVGVFATFKPRSSGMEYGEFVAFVLTFAGGMVTLALGYASAILLGGKASIEIVELTSRINKSKHALEIVEEPKTKKQGR